ncbi:DapH/DapD/GlmU-related protein [Bacteroides sp.]|uniref:acyltransferase n=1 Tax=Bacteroides sp. TaxID=29523 RepID=UPI0025C3C1B6|nr:acyltransferase [Bacteroides sp.]
MIEFIKRLYHSFQLWKTKQHVSMSAIIGENSIICSSAHVKLLHGSEKKDIKIGSHFKFVGELISSHHGKIEIGDHCLVGPNCVVGAVNSIKIGNYVRLSTNVIMIDNNNHSVNPIDRKIMNSVDYSSPYRSWKYTVSKPIVVCDNVWIGRNSVINKGVTIGENSIVAACSVVTKNVPANCIVAGNPAKVVKIDIDKEPRLIPDNGEL